MWNWKRLLDNTWQISTKQYYVNVSNGSVDHYGSQPVKHTMFFMYTVVYLILYSNMKRKNTMKLYRYIVETE